MPNQNSASTSDNNKETLVNITEAQLQALLKQAAAEAIAEAFTHVQTTVTAVPVPAVRVIVGSRQATEPEACAAHKFLSILDQGLSKVIVGTRDKVVVPMNLWVVDKAAPQALAVVAAGSVQVATRAAKVTGFFTRVAEKAAAKSLALTAQ